VDYLALVLSRHSTWLLARLGYRLEQARLGCIIGCGLDFDVGSGFQQIAVKSSDSNTSKLNTDFPVADFDLFMVCAFKLLHSQTSKFSTNFLALAQS
jgi:hypothetical protein